MIASGEETNVSSSRRSSIRSERERSSDILSPPEPGRRQSLQDDSFHSLMQRLGVASPPEPVSAATDSVRSTENMRTVSHTTKSKKKAKTKLPDFKSPTALLKKDYHQLVEDQPVARTPTRPSSISRLKINSHDDEVFQVTPVTPGSFYRRSSSSSSLITMSAEKSLSNNSNSGKRKPHQPKSGRNSMWKLFPSLKSPEKKLYKATPLPDVFGEDEDEDLSIDNSHQEDDEIFWKNDIQSPSLSNRNRKASSSSLPELPVLARAVSDGAAASSFRQQQHRPSWTPRPPTLSRGLSMSGSVTMHDPFGNNDDKDLFDTDPFEHIPPPMGPQRESTLSRRRRSMPTIAPEGEAGGQVDEFTFDDMFGDSGGNICKSKSFNGSYADMRGSAHQSRPQGLFVSRLSREMSQSFSEALDLDPFEDDEVGLKSTDNEDRFVSLKQAVSKNHKRLGSARRGGARTSDSTESTVSIFSSLGSLVDHEMGSPGSRSSRSADVDRNSLSQLINNRRKNVLQQSHGSKTSASSASFISGSDINSIKSQSIGSVSRDTNSKDHLPAAIERSTSSRSRRGSYDLTPENLTSSPKRWSALLASAESVPAGTKEPVTPSSSSSKTADKLEIDTKQKKKKSKMHRPRRNSEVEPRALRIGMDGTLEMATSPNVKDIKRIKRVTSDSSLVLGAKAAAASRRSRKRRSRRKSKQRKSKSPKRNSNKSVSRIGSLASLPDVDETTNEEGHSKQSSKNSSSSRRRKTGSNKRESTSPKRSKKKHSSDAVEVVESMTMSKAKTKMRRSTSGQKLNRKVPSGLIRPASMNTIDESVLTLLAETEQLHKPLLLVGKRFPKVVEKDAEESSSLNARW